MRLAIVALASTMILLCAAVFFAASSEVGHVRGDVCAWAAVHRQQVTSLPQTRQRAALARADLRLSHQLGCNP